MKEIARTLLDVETLQSLERKAIHNNDDTMIKYARNEQYKVLKQALTEEVEANEKYDVINQLYRIMSKAIEYENEIFADAVKNHIEGLK